MYRPTPRIHQINSIMDCNTLLSNSIVFPIILVIGEFLILIVPIIIYIMLDFCIYMNAMSTKKLANSITANPSTDFRDLMLSLAIGLSRELCIFFFTVHTQKHLGDTLSGQVYFLMYGYVILMMFSYAFKLLITGLTYCEESGKINAEIKKAKLLAEKEAKESKKQEEIISRTSIPSRDASSIPSRDASSIPSRRASSPSSCSTSSP
jgi:hypothetical protein